MTDIGWKPLWPETVKTFPLSHGLIAILGERALAVREDKLLFADVVHQHLEHFQSPVSSDTSTILLAVSRELFNAMCRYSPKVNTFKFSHVRPSMNVVSDLWSGLIPRSESY